MPFIIKVAGAYIKYPAKRSASAEPRPADKNIYPQGSKKADAKTTASPRFMYPPRGDGNLIIIVATQVRAASNADITIFCVVVFTVITY